MNHPILDSLHRANSISLEQTGKPAATHYITDADVAGLASEVSANGSLPPSITRISEPGRSVIVERLIRQQQLVVMGVPVKIAQVEAA